VRRTAERLVAAVVLMVLVLMSTVALDVTSSGADPLQSTTLDPGGTWLDLVNDYRAMAGLAPVVEEPSWSDGLAKHLTYLQQTPASFKTGAYASAHTENPASPWYMDQFQDWLHGRTYLLPFNSGIPQGTATHTLTLMPR